MGTNSKPNFYLGFQTVFTCLGTNFTGKRNLLLSFLDTNILYLGFFFTISGIGGAVGREKALRFMSLRLRSVFEEAFVEIGCPEITLATAWVVFAEMDQVLASDANASRTNAAIEEEEAEEMYVA